MITSEEIELFACFTVVGKMSLANHSDLSKTSAKSEGSIFSDMYYENRRSKKFMKISEFFKLDSHRQSNFDFIDLKVDQDNRLFLDPARVEAETKYKSWSDKMQDFHNTVFSFYDKDEKQKAKELFVHSKESNEFRLGYSTGKPRGKGNSKDSLGKVFDFIEKEGLFDTKIVGGCKDFPVFIPGFDRDLMSDLVVSILKSELVDFTIEQCTKHGIKRRNRVTFEYWDSITHKWEIRTERLPEIKNGNEPGKPIIFLPKELVVRKYLYSVEGYLSKALLVWEQKEHKEKNTDLYKENASKQGVLSKKKIEQHDRVSRGLTRKEYALDKTKTNEEIIIEYRKDSINSQLGTNSNKMTDEELEIFIDSEENNR